MTFGIITVKRNRLFRTERKNRFAFSTTGASSGPFVAGRTIIDLPRRLECELEIVALLAVENWQCVPARVCRPRAKPLEIPPG